MTPEERIECADRLFVSLLEKSTDGVFIVQHDALITYVNRQATELLGFSAEELLAVTYPYLLADEHKAEGLDWFNAFFRDKKGFDRYETIMVTKDGRTLAVEVSVFDAAFKGAPAQCIVVRDVSVHKKMEAEIQENSYRYKDLFDNANDLILNTSFDGRFLYTNRTWEETLGYTEADMASKTIFDIVHPDGREQGVALLQRIFSGEAIPSVTVAFASKTGEKIFLEGDISAHIVGGALVSARGIFRNITKKLINERRIRELASIVDRSFEAIMITDIQGTIQYVNDSWERLNGWTAEEVTGKVTPRVIKSGVQDAAFYEAFWKSLLAGDIIEKTVTNKRKDGTLYQAEIIAMPLKDEAGVITGFAGFQHDVTARNQAQTQLIEEKEFSDEVVENANAIIIILDTAGTVTGFNQKAEATTGYVKAEIMGKNLFETIVPRDKYPAVWEKFAHMQQGEEMVKSFENPVLTKSGSERIVAWTNSEIKKDGKTIAVISFGTDITDRKSIERELLEKNKSLEQFKDLMVGRELKMIELKKELEQLKNPSTAYAEKTIN